MAVSCPVGGGKLMCMRDSDDDTRGEDQHTPQPAATEPQAATAAVARMLANPRRVRRA
jgi:hypothetical protein